ncbi:MULTISPECIES: hypothetical protein [Neobacillus]|jgi:hypothetical protein|nr:hypothetical protein [Neobacillus sp. PS2-9]WML56443.1 hypothetical protein RCG25_16055 [Neobacillus sp. PS2-9]
MSNKKLMMATLGLGAAFILRNEKSRKILKEQFQAFAEKSRK